VIEAGGIEEVFRAVEGLAAMDFTALLPPGAFEGGREADARRAIPERVSLGLSLVGETRPPGGGEIQKVLEEFQSRSIDRTGRRPRYARVDASWDIDLRRILKNSSYACFLDGRGYNRFGDEAHVLRLLDTAAVERESDARAALPTYVGLFSGRYWVWPVAAFLRLAGSRRKGG
jgi:hypothetical protein